MALLLSQPLAAHDLVGTPTDSPAWLEIERLRSRRHLLTLRPSFTAMGIDREKERRRKERQWQRWQHAMDLALDALRHEMQTPPTDDQRCFPPSPLSPCDMVMNTPSESRPALSLTTTTKSLSLSNTNSTEPETDRFQSRSPTVYSPSPRSKRPALKIIIDYVYAFTFTCPAGPVWPLQKAEALSGTTLQGSSFSSKCNTGDKETFAQDAEPLVVVEANEEENETLVRGTRLLERKSSAVRAKIHRKTLWRQHCRRVAEYTHC